MSANPRYARIGAIAVVAVATAASTHWLSNDGPGTPPSARWTHVAAEDTRFEPMSEVDALSPLTCELELPSEAWVYAISHDTTRGALALWPSEQLRTNLPGNPLPAGSHTLPGRHLDNDLHWHSGDVIGPITFCVLVSDAPLPELERTMHRMQQVGNGAFPQRPLLGTYAPDGGMDVVPSPSTVPDERFRAAIGIQRFQHDGVMHELRPGLFASTLRLRVRASATTDGPLLDRVREELGRELGPILDPSQAPTTPR